MRGLVLLLLLASCAAPACRPVTITEEAPPQVIERIIVIHDRPVHYALLHDYAQTLTAEKSIVLKSKAPAIDRLIALNTAAQAAITPIQRANHRATPAEIARAIATLGALQAYIISQKH